MAQEVVEPVGGSVGAEVGGDFAVEDGDERVVVASALLLVSVQQVADVAVGGPLRTIS